MPNKFSHSVVLAHYSSLGLIDLPESQRITSLNSSQPTSLRTPSTGSKAQSTCIEVSDGANVSANGKQRSCPDQASRPSAIPDAAAGRRSSRRQVIIDTDKTLKDESTATQVDVCERASPMSTSGTNSRSVQRNNKHYSIQPAVASSLDNKQSVNGKQPSQAIRIENPASSETSPVSNSTTISDHLHHDSQPATTKPAATKSTSHRDKDARKVHAQTHPKAPLTQTPQTSANSRILHSSPVPSTIAETVSSSKSSQPASLSRDLSTYTVETRIFNPILESADFDGFEDVEEPQEIQKITIINPNSTSKVRPSRITGWPSELGVAHMQKDESNNWRQRSLTLDLTGPEAATPEPVNRDMSSQGSFDSLSSLSSFNIPILEREHPLRQNKAVRSRSTRPSGVSSHFFTSNRERDDNYSLSLFDVGSSSRNNPGARHLEHVRRDLVPEQSFNRDRDHKADPNPVSEAGADSPPDITMHRVRKEAGSPLAQVEMMLQKREEESYARGGIANTGRGPSRENKIRGAEMTSKELKKNTSVSGENVNSYKHANAKLRKKEGGGLFHRLKGQNPLGS